VGKERTGRWALEGRRPGAPRPLGPGAWKKALELGVRAGAVLREEAAEPGPGKQAKAHLMCHDLDCPRLLAAVGTIWAPGL
jgi:hypothetical protein